MDKTPLIKPFSGLRFPQSDISRLICPPYDIISPEAREKLYEVDPHNAIRLEYPLPEGDLDAYETAARHWREWRAEGVLKEDEPSLYLCRTDFEYEGEELKCVFALGEVCKP